MFCVLFVFRIGVEHELLLRSMRPKTRCPFRTNSCLLSRQLGVEVEAELEVDLVVQVVVDKEIYKTTNLRNGLM